MGPINVAQMVSRLCVGGGTRTACLIAANLDASKFHSILIGGHAGPGERDDNELIRRLGLSPVYIDGMRRSIQPVDFLALTRVERLLVANKVQILNTHSSKAGALGRIAGVLRLIKSGKRPRIIHTIHGHVFKGYFNSAVSRAFVHIERALARFTDMILTVSNEVRRDLIDVYGIAPPAKVRVMPLGLDFGWIKELSRHRGWLRERIGVTGSTCLIGAIGRLAPVKNHALMLKAFQRAQRKADFDAVLVIFGDGELRSELEKECGALGIADRVVFRGWELDTARIFSDLDITCLSSVNEGLPLTLLESVAAGVPIVSTCVGGIADLLTQGIHGEMVRSGDAEALAAALWRAAQKRSRIDDTSSREIRTRYSVDSLIKYVTDIYEESLLSTGAIQRAVSAPV